VKYTVEEFEKLRGQGLLTEKACIHFYTEDGKCPEGFEWSKGNGDPETCRKCPQFANSRIDASPEAFERLRLYVKERLLKSGVISKEEADPVNPNSVAAHIVAEAWRQYNRKFYADMNIVEAIKFPPPPIDSSHFSLKAFVKTKEKT
jgi:hypothetical protein